MGEKTSTAKSSLARFLPHAVLLGGVLAYLGFGVATNDRGSARFFGYLLGTAIDPFNIILAAGLGIVVRRHLILVPCLIVLGVGLAVIVAEMNEWMGSRLTSEIILAKIFAALTVGYIANLVLTIFKRLPDDSEIDEQIRFSKAHKSEIDECTNSIREKWLFYNQEIKFKPFTPLTEIIDGFADPIRAYVETEHPNLMGVFWMMVISAIHQSETHMKEVVNVAAKNLEEKYGRS